MIVEFEELIIQDIESIHKVLLDEVSKIEEKSFILDFAQVERIDLSAIQLILSLKKYCESLNIDLKFINMNSSQLKQSIKVFNLTNLLGIE